MPRSRYADDDEEETTRRPARASSRYPDDDEDERPAKRSRYADDDEEEEAPRRRRPAARDDDEEEEERPRRRRPASRDDDDEEDERPRRRRAAARDDDEEEEERPRRRRPAARDEDDDEEEERPRSRRRARDDDEDEEEEERPRRSAKKSSPEKSPGRGLKRGWGAANRVKESDSAFASRLKLSEDSVIVKFLEDEPYVSYRSHWLDGRKGQKSFTCIADESPKGCPLCDAGDRASGRYGFNVVLLVSDDEPVVKSYEVGARVLDQLKNFNDDSRQGPLSKHYWAISRTGKGGSTATSHQMVKERDLDEWGIEPLDPDELDEFAAKAYQPDIVTLPTRKELIAIVEEDLDD